MREQICFFVSIAFSFVAWGVVTSSLILPELRRRQRSKALRPLLMFHSFRFVGLSFLRPFSRVLLRPASRFRGKRRSSGIVGGESLVFLALDVLRSRLGIVAASSRRWGRQRRCTSTRTTKASA